MTKFTNAMPSSATCTAERQLLEENNGVNYEKSGGMDDNASSKSQVTAEHVNM